MFFLDHIWIVPLLPLFGAAVMFFFGRAWISDSAAGGHASHHETPDSSPAVTHHDAHAVHGPADDLTHAEPAHHAPERLPHSFVSAICVGTIVIAFAWSCVAVWQYTDFAHARNGAPFEKVMYTWLGSGTGHLNYATHDGGS